MIGCNSWTCFIITFSFALAVYLSTVAPSTVGGDTGELLGEGCKLGTAHPPGYPAIIILFHGVTKLGGAFGLKPALSVNILCCILGATSAGLLSSSVYLLCTSMSSFGSGPINSQQKHDSKKKQRRTRKKKQQHSESITDSKIDARDTLVALSATSSALMFAFSPIAWQYSVTAEVRPAQLLRVGHPSHRRSICSSSVGTFDVPRGCPLWSCSHQPAYCDSSRCSCSDMGGIQVQSTASIPSVCAVQGGTFLPGSNHYPLCHHALFCHHSATQGIVGRCYFAQWLCPSFPSERLRHPSVVLRER